MTSKMLAHRVCKAVTGRDISDVPLDLANEVLDSLNTTLARWLYELPQDRRTEPFGATVRAPVNITINVTSGSKTITFPGGTFPAGGFADAASAIGGTMLVNGDNTRNMLTDTGTLLYPYTGTTGAQPANLFGDGIQLPAATWQVEGDVELAPSETAYFKNRVLSHNPHRRTEIGASLSGEPREWWMEPLQAPDEVDNPRFLLRTWPLSNAAYNLRLVLSRYPVAFALDDLFTNRALPFGELEGSLFVTAAKGDLAALSTSAADGTEKLVAAGMTAFDQLLKLQRPLHTQPEFVGTPHGF